MKDKELDIKKYVVLDVETNGLSSLKDDLLSITIFDPATNYIYNRFLPLELNELVLTEDINGITEEMLEGKKPLNQDEVNEIIKTFNLDNKIILTYGEIDEKFIKNYFKRHHIDGYNRLNFFNIKHKILTRTDRFFENTNNCTKDNLCKIYKIENVREIHSGSNDCILEWNLFKKIYNKFLLVKNNKVYELSKDYVIPATFLDEYSNLKYYVNIPKIYISSNLIFSFKLNEKIERFGTNINGIAIEHLISTLVKAKKLDNFDYLFNNKKNIKYVGTLPNENQNEVIPVVTTIDGKILSLNSKYENEIAEINKNTETLEKQINPLIDYIKNDIFKSNDIFSQELVIDKNANILCVCDLSNKDTVLEIKTTINLNFDKFKNQLYFQSKGRNTYVLHLDWFSEKINIYQINFISNEQKKIEMKEKNILKRKNIFQSKIRNKDIEVINYIKKTNKIKFKCKKCNYTWEIFNSEFERHPFCPKCQPTVYTGLRKEMELQLKEINSYGNDFKNKVFIRSNKSLIVLKYYGLNSVTKIGCINCNYIWKTKPHFLLKHCYCPNCNKKHHKLT